MSAESEIEKLANFIMSEVEGEPSKSEGAGITAVRIITRLQKDQEKYNHLIAALMLIYPAAEGQIKTTILHHLLAAGVEIKE